MEFDLITTWILRVYFCFYLHIFSPIPKYLSFLQSFSYQLIVIWSFHLYRIKILMFHHTFFFFLTLHSIYQQTYWALPSIYIQSLATAHHLRVPGWGLLETDPEMEFSGQEDHWGVLLGPTPVEGRDIGLGRGRSWAVMSSPQRPELPPRGASSWAEPGKWSWMQAAPGRGTPRGRTALFRGGSSRRGLTAEGH